MSLRLSDLTIAILVVTALGTGCGDEAPSSPPPPPPTPTQIGFTVQPSQALRDSVIAPAVQVEVRGASGARIAGATNTVTLALAANAASAPLIGTASVAAVDGIATFTNLAGGEHTCGVTGALEAYCWGGANTYGQLGDGTTTQRTTPVLVTGGVGFSRIALGGEFSCGIAAHQKAYCWGRNADGQLGLGSFVGHLTPQPVAGSINPTGVRGGERHACTTTFDGFAYCWGSNAFGKLGDGTATTRPGPNVVVH